MNQQYHVPGLSRALEVIEYLAECGHSGATLTELTAALGYPKNSIFRITTTLLDKGYFSRDPDSQKFRMTKKFLSYGLVSVTDRNIIEQALDVMRHLRDETNTSTFIGVLHNGAGMILEQAPGGFPFKLSVDPGTRFKLHCSAPGKALLAFVSEEERELLLKKIRFTLHTPQTITAMKPFRTELKQVKDLGYALDCAEEFDGIHCIGAPIFDYTNQAVAAIWISGASFALPPESFSKNGQRVKTAALKISERLGYLSNEKERQDEKPDS
ncbi:IclR family transcriptional regulator [Pontiellaceae bacterium B1224]|nr:IclR family transcriptional regulator [Pontiellaceae bacterium B1224]